MTIPSDFHHRRVTPEDWAAESKWPANVVTITDDGINYHYRVESHERLVFKAWATAIFAGGMNCKRITGRWPFYDVLQPS